jgi:tripartite-type tricarboxylate transporter receptor subunit TctC
MSLALSSNASWPQGKRTIKLVVPFAPGGGADILARMLADQIGSAQPVSLIVENRPGAGTVIGTEAVARAAPDGNTLLLVTDTFVLLPHLRKLSYDPLSSFEPICHLASTPQVIVVNATSPYRTLPDLIDAARAEPNSVTVASPGPGSVAHVAVEVLKHTADVRMTYVPYPGVAPALSALMGDHITAAFSAYTAVAEHLRSGRLRAIAATSSSRLEALPDVPTATEFGYKDLEADLWYGLYAPAKTQPATLLQSANWFASALRAPELAPKLAAQGLLPLAICG